MDILVYVDDEGDEVKTAQFLRNRGSCCKTCCRHCPYGHTLKEKGLQFTSYGHGERDLAQSFVNGRRKKEQGIAASLLKEAGMIQEKEFSLDDFAPENLHFILLKERKIGLAVIGQKQVKEIFLDNRYQNQGIDGPIVESFFFGKD